MDFGSKVTLLACIYIYVCIWQFLFFSEAQRVVMTHTAGGDGIGGANLVSDRICINICVRTLHGRKASNASQASNASSRINLHIRRAKIYT